jgi:hypothetical protein
MGTEFLVAGLGRGTTDRSGGKGESGLEADSGVSIHFRPGEELSVYLLQLICFDNIRYNGYFYRGVALGCRPPLKGAAYVSQADCDFR